MSEIKVELITYTPNPDNIVYMAAKTCYSKSVDYTVDYDKNKRANLISKVLKSGHTSILEHVSYTFGITGVSRVFLAQVTRHRIGVAFSVRSMRYVNLSDTSMDDMYYPGIKPNEVIMKAYEDSFKSYNDLIEMGIDKEDARYVLPNGSPSPMMITMNARELLHYFNLRCCTRAQEEHRIVATKMLRLVKTTSDVIFRKAGPSCVSLGYCPEGEKSCGIRPTLDKLLDAYKRIGE